jgi:uncharacterized protein YhaN
VRITDVQIDGFGVWSDLKLEHLSQGLSVLYGPNEAGKTTLLQFVRSVLYGYCPERRSRYLPPLHGGRGGGALGVVDVSGRFTVRRTPGNSLSEDLGRVEVVSSSNGARQGQHILATMLSGVDEAIFNNVFAVGLRELQELGTLDDTDAAAHLYKLTSGLDRVSLVDVMRDIETARNQILAPDSDESQLLGLFSQREKLQGQIQDLTTRGQRWGQLAAQRKELQEEAARLEESIERMERESRAVEVALRVRTDWLRRVEVRKRLEKLGKSVELPERAVERLDDLNAQINAFREEVEDIKRQRRVIVEEVSTQPINRPLWAHSSRLEAVCEHGPWITSLESQVKSLHDEIAELEKGLRAQWEKLGISPDDMPDLTPEISQRVLATLRGPARAVHDAKDRLAAVQAEREDTRRQAQEIQDQLGTELAETGEKELAKALEAAGLRVTRLRRRVQLEERMDKIERHRKELEEDRREMMEEQVLPVPTLVWCGVPFVLGVMMILASFLWEPVAKLGWTVTILGFACWAIAVFSKILLEKSTSRELDACLRQLDKVKGQIRTLKEERDELDAQLPAGGGPLDARLTAAEQYVKKLEELTPLDLKRQSALTRAETNKDKVTKATEDLKDAQLRWRDALRAANLPDSFQPEHIQQFSEGSDQTVQLARRLHARREEHQSRQTELTTVTERIDKLLKEVKITAASDDPRTQLRQISAALTEQKRWIERRKELKGQHRELKKRFRQSAGELRRLTLQRHLLLKQAGVADEAELRKTAARQAKIDEFTAEHVDLNERIKLTVGNQCTEAAVGEVLETHGDDKLESYWDRLVARLQDAQAKLTQLHQTRGEMNQEMKSLAEDRRLPEARLQLGCVEEQIRQATAQWRLLAVASLMLEAIRQIYETERQPETLAEASTYLAQLTEGRYTRVWTPLNEDVLRVDTADGQSLSLDVLSQGTREAVFIGVRMALAAAYARRGAVLPLVLDDVLVNFDTRRAKAAARVLRDFAAAGHQMLLFTCHHHIMRIFESVDAEVRLLPARDGLGAFEADEDVPAAPPAAAAEPTDVLPEPVSQESEIAEPEAAEVEEPESTEVTAEEEPEPEEAEEPEVAESVAATMEPEVQEEPEPEFDSEEEESVWDDELRLAEEDEEPVPAYAGATEDLGFRDRWWEDEAA